MDQRHYKALKEALNSILKNLKVPLNVITKTTAFSQASHQNED